MEIQGEYAGEIEHDGGRVKLGVQVLAQGRGRLAPRASSAGCRGTAGASVHFDVVDATVRLVVPNDLSLGRLSYLL